MPAGYFFRNPFFLPWLYPGLTWRLPAEEKILYLTFDDGPVPGPTEFALDELARAGAKATFFCIGDNVRKHPAVYERVLREGHAVGNHTFNHLSGWKTPTEDYINNVRLCDEVLQGHEIGARSKVALFRPPYGRITRRQIAALSSYRIIMWDVLTNDYAQSLSPSACLRGSLAASRPGSIVVFHDSLKAEKNLRYVLPRYLDHFAGQGYTFRSLP
ncbi:MAG: polysaccharide deacetylase family protein [Cyclobacteriaceae bacterium]|nr:polysaccharide deacetylase family protein [Cyclobacteriaceae bacterium]